MLFSGGGSVKRSGSGLTAPSAFQEPFACLGCSEDRVSTGELISLCADTHTEVVLGVWPQQVALVSPTLSAAAQFISSACGHRAGSGGHSAARALQD